MKRLSMLLVCFVIGALLTYSAVSTIGRATDKVIGYPANPAKMKTGSTYEVIAQWQNSSNFITLLRESDGRFRLFGFNEVFVPGFYRADTGSLFPLIPTPFYQIVGTNPPTAYGATK